MNCGKYNDQLADMLFEPESATAAVRAHVEDCPDCREEVATLRETMLLMDAWQAPDPTPYFDTRLRARLRAEQDAAPAGWFERLRARFLFGTNLHLRPIAASALAVVLLAGGGTFVGLNLHQPTVAAPQESATVKDLQNLDGNAQVFQQLDTLDQNDQNDNDADDSTSNL